MPHETPLITTLVVGLSLAFIFGVFAHRLKLPLLAGYLMAGVVLGPFTPGFVADQEIASELAELGVILLMFGVGMHFSLKELLAVKMIAIPGAIGQIAVATAAGAALGWVLGWGIGAGLIFGLSLSVASTVVLLRALQERGIVKEERGHIAVGWLIVEDLVMVIALVMIPPLAGLLGGISAPVEEGAQAVARLGFGPVAATLMLTAVKVASFVAIMLIIGTKAIPAILHYVAHTGVRELFRLSVLAIALGIAWASSTFFGVSFALGAFFAGMVMSTSTLSTQAMKETLPLRDAFAVLFFVSVGMLFNPSIIWTQPFSLLVTVLIIVVVKAVAAYAIVRAFGRDRETALTIGASLAQIGEFSFILIVMGVKLWIVPVMARDLVVAGALVSILVNPLMFKWLDKLVFPEKPTPKPVGDADEGDTAEDTPKAA
ncbi:cation:proton antiporter domain-containing protein [Fuscibacter oryzae]|uniref:Cation:proton antiporter n=1 Tax=Fuscibacter oryzae TaxID=2803939 RepID=A0A8J7SVN6_9RHOB|nr:cation:proton antiporter [Fuscibacter oryzae]MBL4929702.1 cation:proton antiporter [Fuscibacter oryzae]